MFWAIDYACLALVVAAAVLVIRLRNLNGSVMALSAMGTVLALLFVVLGAPDDAHAQIVVGSIAVPTLYLIAIAKIRTEVVNEPELGEQGDTDAAADADAGRAGSGGDR
ncbi:Na(+)/H(+) antiporter subunit B [Rugosimonospora africana]|uniref:MrpA C-terminal/MbhD domain-containing protein n=1 Tax=Rugosimonospora africana TaxID=556532 RepID=A0A8J3QRI5_9ACTN|nr:DUF4040 domain-containing protein [Rugosimonospora africana]GIH14467.1 hypothetical protein Raf01_26390 [Rugosimonospora africana]